jgi:hypothetical protein
MEQPKASTSGRSAGDSSSSTQDSFIPQPSFTGAREGYVFTTGDKGTGYYKDDPLHLRNKGPAGKPRPAVLKSGIIIKGLRKPTNLPDAKKRKTGSESKPTYLKEMDKYHAMNCSSNTQHDRPLVK